MEVCWSPRLLSSTVAVELIAGLLNRRQSALSFPFSRECLFSIKADCFRFFLLFSISNYSINGFDNLIIKGIILNSSVVDVDSDQ